MVVFSYAPVSAPPAPPSFCKRGIVALTVPLQWAVGGVVSLRGELGEFER